LVWGVPLPYFLLLLAIIASVVLRGAVEPALVLGRSMLYGIVVVITTTLFVMLEALLQSQAVAALGLPEGTAAIVTGVAVALGFGPIRARSDALIAGWIAALIPAADRPSVHPTA